MLCAVQLWCSGLLRRLVRVRRAEQSQQVRIAEMIRIDVKHLAVDLQTHVDPYYVFLLFAVL